MKYKSIKGAPFDGRQSWDVPEYTPLDLTKPPSPDEITKPKTKRYRLQTITLYYYSNSVSMLDCIKYSLKTKDVYKNAIRIKKHENVCGVSFVTFDVFIADND
jgi:hypothetical protein